MAGVGISTSTARQRPRPSALGSSAWVMMPSRFMDSWVRTWSCWCGGKTSMMRLMVWAAELVCRVANVRWPVSAMVMAAWMVSRSRISPISTTSGSSRRTERSASGKLLVSACSSRWLTMALRWECRYSMGSSMVMMWTGVLLVDLVDHRGQGGGLARAGGPGDQDQAAGLVGHLGHDGGQAQLFERPDLVGDAAERPGDGAALHEDVGAEAGQALDAEGEVKLPVFLEFVFLVVVQDAVDHLLGLGRRERRVLDPLQQAVDADQRRRVGGDVQVGPPLVDHDLQ